MAKLPTKIIWAPTLAFHDPDPPLRIESSSVLDATLQSDGVGAFNAFSGSAIPEDATFESVVNVGTFGAESGADASATFESDDNLGTFGAFEFTGTTDGVWSASGTSTTDFYGDRILVARCEDAYTYDPLGGPSWDGTLRREPEIMVRTASNDSPSATTFTDEEDPQLGSNVQLDMGDGFGVIAGGVVQSKVMKYDGNINEISFDTTVADYLWLLNKRRPFGCFENMAADLIAQALRVGYAPADFSGAGIVSGLPVISVQFDGTLDFSGCMSVIANKIAGRFKVDKDKVLHLFQDDPTPGPAIIDDNNMMLVRDQPLTVKTDISQLRNRVFVRGEPAHLLNDISAGATEIEVDGIDVFDVNGGEAIIGCDRFTYTGVNKSYIYPPPPVQLDALVKTIDPSASTYTPGAPSARWDDTQNGPIGTRVRYTVTYLINGVETARGHEFIATPEQVSVGVAMSGGFPGVREVFPGLGFAVGDGALFGWVTHDGKVVVHTGVGSIGFASVFNMVPSKHVYGPWPTQGVNTVHPDPRVKSFRLWRTMTWIDSHWHEVLTVNEGTTPVDVFDPASLGGAPDLKADVYFFSGDCQNDSGSRVWITNVPTGPPGTTERRVYREEQFNGFTAWTLPRIVMTIPGNGSFSGAEIEDTTPTSVHAWERGVIQTDGSVVPEDPTPTNPTVAPPPEPKPKIRLTLTGVSGLDEDHFEGDEVAIFIQRDDLPSQLAMAQAEGGDGLHEFFVVDTTLRTNAELIARGDAELTLFKDPIIEARYSTFDPLHMPGATVEFNLSNPPFVASLKITEVSIDKVHYQHGHVARYNVTASSVKFTLQDLLRRTILRPY